MKISIVTTIYKAEKDLPRLLDSMMAMESQELEFFLIDNGSPDRCGEICAEYAKKDSRFFVRTLAENIGYIRARMLGIKECHGEFVGFCDSDDFLEPHGYDRAVEIIGEQDCDLYVTSHKVHFMGSIDVMNSPFPVGLYQQNEIEQTILPQAFGFLRGRDRLHGYMWKQVYRKQLIQDAGISLIEELKPWEDQIFNIDVIKHCQRLYVDNVVIYNYIANSVSITANMIQDFDGQDYWRKVKLLFEEKDKRASTSLQRRANANASLFLMDLLVVGMCRSKSISNREVKRSLSSLFGKDKAAKRILSDSCRQDLSKRLMFVQVCLKWKLYSMLVKTVRHKLSY